MSVIRCNLGRLCYLCGSQSGAVHYGNEAVALEGDGDAEFPAGVVSTVEGSGFHLGGFVVHICLW